MRPLGLGVFFALVQCGSLCIAALGFAIWHTHETIPPLIRDAPLSGRGYTIPVCLSGEKPIPSGVARTPVFEARLHARFPQGSDERAIDAELAQVGFTKPPFGCTGSVRERFFQGTPANGDQSAEVFWQADRRHRVTWIFGVTWSEVVPL